MSEIPQVMVSVSGGIADAQITRGDENSVDLILVDWDNVTPDSWSGNDMLLETIDDAVENLMRLPPKQAAGWLRDIEDWLDTFLDPDTGYTEKDDFRKDAIEVLKDVRSKITDLDLRNE